MQILRKFCHNEHARWRHIWSKRLPQTDNLEKNHMLNAFITILSSRVILPMKMQKQVVIPKDIILKAKANKYQQNQTILP